ncbi:MAG: ankyrin repeat domain-containing protein, partial [bacterium]
MKRFTKLFTIALLIIFFLGIIYPADSSGKSSDHFRKELRKKGYLFERDVFKYYLLRGDTKVVDLFLKAGMDPSVRVKRGSKPILSYFAKQNKKKALEFYITHPRIKNSYSLWNQDLKYASRNGEVKFAEKILKINRKSPVLTSSDYRKALIGYIKYLRKKNKFNRSFANRLYNGLNRKKSEISSRGIWKLASETRKWSVMKWTLDHFIDGEWEPIFKVSAGGNVKRIRKLIKQGADPNARDVIYQSPLSIATQFGRFESVKTLVKNGARIDTNVFGKQLVSKVNRHGRTRFKIRTPLLLSAYYGHERIFSYLFNQSAKPFKQRYRKKLMRTAVAGGNPEIVQFMIDEGISFTKQRGSLLTTALIFNSSELGNSLLSRFLKSDTDFIQPKHLALSAGQGWGDFVQRIIEAGDIDPDTRLKYQETALCQAARSGHASVVKILLERGADPYSPSMRRFEGSGDLANVVGNCTEYAVARGHLEVVRVIQNRATDEDERIPGIEWATKNGHLEVVKFLVENGSDTDKIYSFGYIKNPVRGDLLSVAVMGGDNAVVDYFLDIFGDNARVNMAFFTALRHGEFELIRRFISHGATLKRNHFKEQWGRETTYRIPIQFAVLNGVSIDPGVLEVAFKQNFPRTVEKLIQEQGISRDKLNRLLWSSSRKGEINVIKRLLKYGVDVNSSDKQGNTALIKAASRASTPTLSILLDHQARINQQNNPGKTPLMVAIEQGNIQNARFLVQNGASVNVRDSRGWTAAHYALKTGHLVLIKRLKDAGSDAGITPIMIAARHAKKDILEELLTISNRVNERDENGYTAITYAVEGNHEDVVDRLIESGAQPRKLDLKKALSNQNLSIMERLWNSSLKISPDRDLFEEIILIYDEDNIASYQSVLNNLFDQTPNKIIQTSLKSFLSKENNDAFMNVLKSPDRTLLDRVLKWLQDKPFRDNLLSQLTARVKNNVVRQ